jgi:hypothetical protein
MKRFILATVLLLLGLCPAGAAGFQWATAPDPDDAPLQVAIWYRSTDKAGDNLIGRERAKSWEDQAAFDST